MQETLDGQVRDALTSAENLARYRPQTDGQVTVK
jgi:hypothetical protein